MAYRGLINSNGAGAETLALMAPSPDPQTEYKLSELVRQWMRNEVEPESIIVDFSAREVHRFPEAVDAIAFAASLHVANFDPGTGELQEVFRIPADNGSKTTILWETAMRTTSVNASGGSAGLGGIMDHVQNAKSLFTLLDRIEDSGEDVVALLTQHPRAGSPATYNSSTNLSDSEIHATDVQVVTKTFFDVQKAAESWNGNSDIVSVAAAPPGSTPTDLAFE